MIKIIISSAFLRACMVACLLPLCLASTSGGAEPETDSEAVSEVNPRAEAVQLRKEIADLRRQLHESERAARGTGGSSDAELASRALLTESLILKERELLEAGRNRPDASAEDDGTGLRELQKGLIAATSHGERVRLLARHRALQRVLIADEVNSNSSNSLIVE